MPSGPFPALRFMRDDQQDSAEILHIHDDGDNLAILDRRPPGPYTELLAILSPSHPSLPGEARQRFARGPMSLMFLRAGDGCDVQDLGIPPHDPAVLVTVHAPLLRQGFTYQALCTYATPATPPDAPKLWLVGPRLQGDHYELVPIPLLAWRRRVYSDKSPLYVEARWHPRHGESLDLKGMRDDPGLKGVAEARRAGKLLREVETRGRPSGPDGFTDAQEFEDTLIQLIQVAQSKGRPLKQEYIATLLRPELAKRRGSNCTVASVDVDVQSIVRLIRKHLSCAWAELVKKALSPS